MTQSSSNTPSSSRGTRIAAAFVGVIGTVAALVQLLEQPKPAAALWTVGGGLAVAAWAWLMLQANRRRTRVVAGTLLPVSLAVASWGALSSAQSGDYEQSLPAPPEQPAVSFGAGIAVGVRPKRLVSGPDGLWTVTDAGAVRVDPEDAESTRTLPVSDTIFDLAVDDDVVALVRDGTVLFYDRQTRRRMGRPRTFSEGPGNVALGLGSAWVGNESHSKLERIDPETKEGKRISLPGVPAGLVVEGRNIWVSIERHVVRVDPGVDEVVEEVETAPGPTIMALGFGSLWVVHPDIRRLTRIDLMSSEREVSTVPISGNTQAIAIAHGSVWLVDASADLLLRVDPARMKVVSKTSTPKRPTGLTEHEGELYLASGAAHAVYPVLVRRG